MKTKMAHLDTYNRRFSCGPGENLVGVSIFLKAQEMSIGFDGAMRLLD
jgi:hypothetical protein